MPSGPIKLQLFFNNSTIKYLTSVAWTTNHYCATYHIIFILSAIGLVESMF